MNINALHEVARLGDQSAEKALFESLAVRFRLFVHQRIRNEEDGEDIVQDTLMAISREYGKLDIETSFAAWAYKVLNNRIMNHLRKNRTEQQRIHQMVEGENLASSANVDPLLEMKLVECLEKIAGVNRRYARILDLHYQGYTGDEVCDKLKIKRNHAYVILSRARSMLKMCLEKGDVL